MKKHYTFITISVLAILALPALVLLKNLAFSESFSCPQGNAIPLHKNQHISQSFIPTTDNLTILSIKTATYKRFFIHGTVKLTITDSNNEHIFSKEASTHWFGDNEFYNLHIPISMLKKDSLYSVSIEYIKAPSHLLGFWTTKNNCYEGILHTQDKKNGPADFLIIKKYSQNNILSNTKELLNRMSQYKAIWFKGYGMPFTFSLYAFLNIIIIIILVRKIF
ncbi:MAG: hypothetical protein A3J63_02740 [Candidatus Moranbacteria bacterium RIFCSPHIGHO2_02_FULL_40_12b]|nr:MAG: hypothetical protein A3J63_02740 [Candidatus Moranbacteria bacterium RIFCSPHIGHO2_02_FULL_40_12b]